MHLVDFAKLPSMEVEWVKHESDFPRAANSMGCQTSDLCQSAQWKMGPGCHFHLASLILSEVEPLFSSQPCGWTVPLHGFARYPLCKIQD